MKKLLLVFLSIAGTAQINSWHGHGGWGYHGWSHGRWGSPYYDGYYTPEIAGVALGAVATGALVAAASDGTRNPEYYENKNKENQRREIKKQIQDVQKDLKRKPNDKDLENELKRLREDLRNV